MAEMRIQLGRLRDSSPLHHATAEKDLVTINVAQQTINDLKVSLYYGIKLIGIFKYYAFGYFQISHCILIIY